MHYIKKLKNESHIIISVDSEKVFDKIQHPFMIKAFQKVDIVGILQHGKGQYVIPTENCEQLKAFPLRSGTRQRCLFWPLLFNTALDILVTAIRQEK